MTKYIYIQQSELEQRGLLRPVNTEACPTRRTRGEPAELIVVRI